MSVEDGALARVLSLPSVHDLTLASRGQAELHCLGVFVNRVADQLECCMKDAGPEVGLRHHVLF
eukprot:6707881-Alexandrium_andersonii.AAC.1